MKKFTFCSIIVAFALCVAAVAQTGAGGAQGTQGSSPSMGQQPNTAQPGMNQPGQSDQNTSTTKAERKLKGCVQSQGGQYVLETKKGKAINLTGQDVSAHVGHEVAVKGNFESAGAGMSPSSSGNSAGAGEKTFNVSNVEMISDTCSAGKNKGSSGNMGTGASPNGTSPSSGTTGTTPPQ